MNAFSVTQDSHGDGHGVIVFALNESEAKAIGIAQIGCDPGDVTVEREPDADKYYEVVKCNCLRWSNVTHLRIYRDLEWWMEDADACEWCGKFEDDQIPESILTDTEKDGKVCSACLAYEQQKEPNPNHHDNQKYEPGGLRKDQEHGSSVT